MCLSSLSRSRNQPELLQHADSTPQRPAAVVSCSLLLTSDVLFSTCLSLAPTLPHIVLAAFEAVTGLFIEISFIHQIKKKYRDIAD